jgi:hypothetical protein
MSQSEQATAPKDVVEVELKMLGAHVPKELYWDFKKAAASRGEQLKDAVAHAARMYIAIGAKKEG